VHDLPRPSDERRATRDKSSGNAQGHSRVIARVISGAFPDAGEASLLKTSPMTINSEPTENEPTENEPTGGAPTYLPARAAAPRSYKQIHRSREDRIVSGLSGGLGRYLNIDPVIVRILFVVLTLFGGSGILLYLIGWVAIPDEGHTVAPIGRLANRVGRRRR
jgi:phage shock protein PspC (stress-responsive transcriptional regulator)